MCTTWHLFTLKSICQLLDHVMRLSSLFWNASLSSSLSTTLSHIVSSANLDITEPDVSTDKLISTSWTELIFRSCRHKCRPSMLAHQLLLLFTCIQVTFFSNCKKIFLQNIPFIRSALITGGCFLKVLLYTLLYVINSSIKIIQFL